MNEGKNDQESSVVRCRRTLLPSRGATAVSASLVLPLQGDTVAKHTEDEAGSIGTCFRPPPHGLLSPGLVFACTLLEGGGASLHLFFFF